MLTPELKEQLRICVAIAIGTRDSRNMPECVWGWGIHFVQDPTRLVVFVNATQAERSFRNLRENGRIAISFDRPATHTAYQLKGRMLGIREQLTMEERISAEQCFYDFVSEAVAVGVPREAPPSLVREPLAAIEIEITDVFLQTPGANAGIRI